MLRLMDVVVERVQPAAMAEMYMQAFLEVENEGCIDRTKVIYGL